MVVLSAVVEILRTFQSGVAVGGVELTLPNGVLQIILAALMLLILVFRRNGLTDGREVPWPFAGRNKAGWQKHAGRLHPIPGGET